MCGRYALTNPDHIVRLFGLDLVAGIEPRYNVAPTQIVPVLRLTRVGERKLEMLKWGLVPYWADDPAIGNRLINARSETAADKPAFRAAMGRRHCLVPASGFFEWKKMDGGGRQPHHICRADGGPMVFAGLWESWREKGRQGAPALRSFTILTTEANELVASLHDRMPVIVSEPDFDRWLEATGTLGEILGPFPSDELHMWPVSRLVNKPENDDPRCVEPFTPESEGLLF